MGNHMDNDKEYEDDLAGGSGISKLYQETGVSGPARQTDEAILAAARRAVDSKPRPISPFGYRWMLPASLAAVLVLTVSIIILQPPSIESTDEAGRLAESDEIRSAPRQVAKQKPRQDDDTASFAQNRVIEEKTQIDARKKETLVGDASAPAESSVVEQQQLAAAPEPIMSPEAEGTIASAAASAPEKWLDKIQKLLRENKQDEATKEFKAFEHAFPDYRVDFNRYPELKALVESQE